jgi:DnaK suppressor protein
MKGSSTKKKTATVKSRSTTVAGKKPATTKASMIKASMTKVSMTKASTTKASTMKASTTKASTTKAKWTTSSKSEPSKPQATKQTATPPKRKPMVASRSKSLRVILLAKREAVMKQIKEKLGQSLTDDQQRRLESAMDSGDQALFDLEREMGIFLQEMRNRERQLIEEALASLDEGTYGLCGECDAEISEKRLTAMPFARYCIECQSRLELLEKIEKGEQRT